MRRAGDACTVAGMRVAETFFSVSVKDMQRAIAFYREALGATVMFESPGWTSLRVAGVRLGLALVPDHVPTRVGLHFAAADLDGGRSDVERAGGRIVSPITEVAPGVLLADVEDTEGNTFTLTRASAPPPEGGS